MKCNKISRYPKIFRVEDGVNEGICYSWSDHFDIIWDSGEHIKTIELSLQNIRKIKDSEIKIDKSLLAKLVVNNDQECFDMVTISPNESHDGDMSGEHIASIYDYNNAKIIMKLWNNLCEKPM